MEKTGNDKKSGEKGGDYMQEKKNGQEEERMEQQKEFLVKFAYWLIWGVIVILLVKCLGSVLLPFVLAFLVAWILSVPVDYVAGKTHIKRGILAITAAILFYVVLALLLYLFGTRVASLVEDTFSEITDFLTVTLLPMVNNGLAWATQIADGGEDVERVASDSAVAITHAGEMVSGISETLLGKVSGIAAEIPGVCMNLLLMVITTVFAELEFPQIRAFVLLQIPEKWRALADELKGDNMGVIGRWVLSYVLIFCMTFAELAAGLFILRIDGAFVLAFVIAVLDILPVLGTGTVLIPWSVIALAAGNFKMGIGVLILYLVITVVRNIVEPKLVGGQMGLSLVVMLPCMIVGLKAFGIIGLFGVPFAVAFLKKLNDRGIITLWKREEKL